MSVLKEQLVNQLKDLMGEGLISEDPDLLSRKATDTWPLRLIQGKLGAKFETALCVAKPESAEDVSKLLRFLDKEAVPVVPYAGGSGVTGGAEANNDSVVISVGEMNEILHLDEENLSVTVQPGVGLRELEDYLNTLNLTSGHYPQSIDLAQIGGLVATRSSGQFSTKYGNIEDLVIGLEGVLPSGEIVRMNNIPRRSTGPDLRQVFIGSEGVLGVITEVTLKVFPQAAERWIGAYGISNMRQGLHIIRNILREGWKPAVIRLHDDMEASMSYSDFVEEGESILLVLSEGPTAYANLEGEAIDQIIQSHGGRSLGEEPVKQWLKNRNQVSELDEYTNQGVLVDTIEVAANWSDIANIYEQVTKQLKEELPELLLIAGHSSHSYEQGTNLYFILGAYPEQNPRDAERVYWRIWSKVMEITLKNNGTICHHHGIGKLRAHWMPEDLGSSYLLLEKIKEALDPKGIMNRGTLLATERDK